MTGVLFGFSAFFAYLAYDAAKLGNKLREFTYEDEHGNFPLSLQEQKRIQDWNLRYGFGDARQMKWVFALLAIGSAFAGTVNLLK